MTRHDRDVLIALVIGFVAAIAANLAYNISSDGGHQIVSVLNPVEVYNAESAVTRVPLGGIYPVTFFFSKTRVDCTNGRVVRHMWEANTGENYLIEDVPAVSHDIDPDASFSAKLSTRPIDAKDLHKMKPGKWSIKTTIFYLCPKPDGGEKMTQETFSTPFFTVHR